ncbi:MAG: YqgE/AlgH family protein [Firmicutes bacterium]|nr:YqgE/AlgH family protein [Bacillota bacterium]
MDIQVPCLLVASPLLSDPNFLHSVVLLVEHDEQGTLGVILNRPLPLTLAQISEESGLPYAGNAEATAFRGGPVEPQRGIVLARGGLPTAEDRVLDLLHFASFRKDLLENLLLDSEARFRLFLGYAGWSAGQLDDEITEGAWSVRPLDSDWILCEDPSALWGKAMEQAGDEGQS